jgi:hypothetical protein
LKGNRGWECAALVCFLRLEREREKDFAGWDEASRDRTSGETDFIRVAFQPFERAYHTDLILLLSFFSLLPILFLAS